MPRVISFIVLVAIILLIGTLFFRVMAQFFLPLFLAVLLVVMFRPLHEWFISKCKGRNRVAAGLTTLAIMMIVLLPLTGILFKAIRQGIELASQIDQGQLAKMAGNVMNEVQDLPQRFGVTLPEGLIPESEIIIDDALTALQNYVAPAALGGAQVVVRVVFGVLVGLAIMILSLYYFLADGPSMIRTLMRLSPLDDRYEEQLFVEFTKISRAVVVAALLSAFVQGILAGIGFYISGLTTVTFLVALTMLFALVPFVGAAAVWVPCCLWLYLHDGKTMAAILLAIYCGLVVSLSDNVIKPLILHGQSGIHPLMALLSILGGVTAMGPIGILVGPMLVAFLQALLNMLNTELKNMERQTK